MGLGIPGHPTSETDLLINHHLDLPLSGSVVSGCPSLSLWSVPHQMLTCKPAAQKSSSDLLDASMVSATSRYIEEQQATQQVCVGGQNCGLEEHVDSSGPPDDSSSHISNLQLIMDQQDQQLEMVSGSIRVLKHMSGRVGEELDEQGM